MSFDRKHLLLYAVTDSGKGAGRPLPERVESALKGGATCIQLREKELTGEALVKEAKEIRALCAAYRVPFLINDDVELAVLLDADGVHVGQKDMEAKEARRRLGPDKIVGVSARTEEQAVQAWKDGADYLGVGAVFHTASKADARQIDHETLRRICSAVPIPAVAIGGITEENVLELKESGISGIAVISAVFAKEDVQAAAARLKELAERIVKSPA
ncbi:MAG TPA: thiamine phosphate synthase [Candidatus Eisenbergiella intestinipullorum]|nr:thiamine phosphate synthase [Candidatus Eisenbergiella intestinipullorum]